MAEQLTARGEGRGPRPGHRPRRRHQRAAGVNGGLTLAALGVVFGDIGTSPLYAVQTVFAINGGSVRATPDDVYGVISLMFWSITVIVSVKYVGFVMRADNDGEGGVLAMAALVRRVLGGPVGGVGLPLLLGVIGACLFYGDSVITPAISVLSAMEGLEVARPGLSHLVLPLAAGILTVLFVGQRYGTQRVGSLFGPVMVVWFSALGLAGAAEVARRPAILTALSPSHAGAFLADRPGVAFVAMGAVVLVITGSEALYADMGHFGRPAVSRAWFFVAFPGLTLNYLGQGALILRQPSAKANPFFVLFPGWAQIPMVLLATAATVIASQAVISGAFSVSRQAVQLGFLPPLRVRQTSTREAGQIYLPAVNIALYLAVLVLVFSFRSSTRLATAYGVAVTTTFLITTALLLTVAHRIWRWATWQVVLVGVVFGSLELIFFAANITKVVSGGWLPLLVAAVLLTVMLTWQRGRMLVTEHRTAMEGPLREFIDRLHSERVPRIRGTAVFPHPGKETTPLALRANVEHNHVLHERVVIVSAEAAPVPFVPAAERLRVDDLGYDDDGIVHLSARFGFAEEPHLPDALREADEQGMLAFPVGPDTASFFVSRATLRQGQRGGMSRWRKGLFTALARNAVSPTEHFCLPVERTVVMGSHIDI